MKINILVTSAGSAIAQGIMKSIKKSKLDYKIITANANIYGAGLYRGKSAYLVPFAKSPDYIDSIIDICKKEKINVILVGMDYELEKLSENKELIKRETGADIIVSPPETIEIANDKWSTQEFLKKNELPYIPSALPENADALIEKEGFPLIIKPRIGDSSKNTFIVNDRKELEKKLSIFKTNSKKENPELYEINPVIQKYMENKKKEFTSTVFAFKNVCYGVISMKRDMRYPGHTTKAEILNYPLINKHIKKVAEKLDIFGPCNFQSRVVDGVPYIFEINCRFSGTTATCTLAGFNHVEECIKKIYLKKEPNKLIPTKGVMLRYFNEVFIPLDEINTIKKERYIKNPKSTINEKL